MNKEIIENLLLSELEEVKCRIAYIDCHLCSGTDKVVIIENPFEVDIDAPNSIVYY